MQETEQVANETAAVRRDRDNTDLLRHIYLTEATEL